MVNSRAKRQLTSALMLVSGLQAVRRDSDAEADGMNDALEGRQEASLAKVAVKQHNVALDGALFFKNGEKDKENGNGNAAADDYNAMVAQSKCSGVWRQCGGKQWKGPTCCTAGLTCRKQDDYYSQCIKGSSGGGISLPDQNQPAPTPSPPSSSGKCSARFEQCGGNNWKGATCCESGWKCQRRDKWYSQCVHSSAPSPPPKAPTPTPPPSYRRPPPRAPKPTGDDGQWNHGTWTTGYWDCCKPSCAWSNKGNVNTPTKACDAKTGKKLSNPNVASVCGGGTAAACADNQPWAVNDSLAYGFAAAAVGGSSGLKGDNNCGQCFLLVFEPQRHSPNGDNWGGAAPQVVGRKMVIQVTNIGYDVTGDHSFDIQIPGAGQGAFTDGCARQFSGYSSKQFDCGKGYGGCNKLSQCDTLPEPLRKGCKWRFEWLRWNSNGQTNNPYVKFRRVKCPEVLTRISGTVPRDDATFR
eukprot:TRINITY_DN48867_c0_g1_i1.p1 TRINITY_DN48867_c0_g1~~TRINITY_DN48867_c0_g1_i1.p1  ORF type:complete len:468 (-),score=45.65 TRINITY_DN48867_c0_g1_i1:128-1531(-)